MLAVTLQEFRFNAEQLGDAEQFTRLMIEDTRDIALIVSLTEPADENKPSNFDWRALTAITTGLTFTCTYETESEFKLS